MSHINRGIWLAVAGLAFSGLAQAAMYKWVDENGVTQYTQYPPPDRKAEVMVPPPRPAEDPEGAQKKLEALLKKQDDQRKAAATSEEEQTQAQDQAAARDKNCQAARGNLAKLTAGGRMRVIAADGTVSYLTDEDRAARTAEANKQIAEYCKD